MTNHEHSQLETIRHSLAHILAQAVQKKYPQVKLGFGPATDTGFFYDFDFAEQAVTAADLKDIEKLMKKIISQKQVFARVECTASEAIEKLKNQPNDEHYKIENIQNLADRGVKSFSFYENGPFLDLCEGPHVENTGLINARCFKLDRIAGAYWLGNEKNPMLSRIYGLAFESDEALKSYLRKREQAEAFDHRKLGKTLDLYHIDDLVGKGLPLWLPHGTVIRDEIESYAKELEFRYGYQRVTTPHITKKELYLKSQHLPAYEESMFPPLSILEGEGSETYYLKPMNCPHHHLIFDCRQRSYRDLPLRLAEYGTCYRYEQSGELSGLLRVRCMTMNDAHIYVREDQIEQEIKSVLTMYQEFYDTFKLKEYTFRLSIRGAGNESKFKGDPVIWQKAELILEKVLKEMNLPFYMGEGEAAFYGPKIDIQFKNLMGREETVSTIQVDFLSPDNFELNYIDAHSEEIRPVIIHRAPLSTHERFISFLIEYYGGAFPSWCAPVQVAIIPVNETCEVYCNEIKQRLFALGFRVEIDQSNNSFNKKIRTNTVRKIPNMLIIGNNEAEQQTVTVRRYGQQEQETLALDAFIISFQAEVSQRKMLREPMGSII